ncbi:hypothetical protein AKJ57_04030 [candidate division MSBL1 archaeon SCGC-AAA259A05]|uniref:Oxidoreductase n=1 Tax=candidate division MSBL1 archaeon SCGC-AAA259A05 TaxID=1698259 RepID=A0A133U910_9EURY|nr:hypothetical protein AKJ57_04030 [candidate division MSBL1 archaeon SCGC-AAA259A05]
MIRIGVVGCGMIAYAHTMAYEEDERVKLVAFCDKDESKAKEFAQKLDANFYIDHEEMSRESLDGISICTPPSTHMKIAKTFLSKQTDVLCEKPLAISASEGNEMIKTAAENNALLLTAFKYRFFDETEKTKELISQGEIGKVITFRNMFGGEVNAAEKWLSKGDISGGGVLMDNGVHSVDLIRFLFGEVKEIMAKNTISVQDIDVEDSARLLLRMKSGSVGTVNLSWSVPHPSPYYLEVYGSENSILVGWNGLYLYDKDKEEWTETGKSSGEKKAFQKEISHFVDCIEEKETPAASGEDGLKALEIIEAAYRSEREGNWVRV